MSTTLESPQGAETGTGTDPHAWPMPVTDDLAYLRTGIANVYFYGHHNAGDRQWVLIDAGLAPWSEAIDEMAATRYGEGSRPSAILLTHGHFDHVGSLASLAQLWDVPVYAHPLEFPYLTGQAQYPPPDPTVGGGLMAELSWLYPRGPVNLAGRIQPLPADGSVPGMPGWQWISTPGHSPGHVSFFRESDRTLIVGDAFVTVKQESAVAVLTQHPELHGPPKYYTIDWPAAKQSVERLAALEPEIAATGHGVPLAGPTLRSALHRLARNFNLEAVPAQGRYTHGPALTDASGPLYIPPPDWNPLPKLALTFAMGVTAGLIIQGLCGLGRRSRKHREIESPLP